MPGGVVSGETAKPFHTRAERRTHDRAMRNRRERAQRQTCIHGVRLLKPCLKCAAFARTQGD